MMDTEKSLRVKNTSPGDVSQADDGDFYIDPELERAALRKFDVYVLPQMMLLVLVAYLDRSNIGTSSFP